MDQKETIRVKKSKNCYGTPAMLTLIKKEEYKNKEYDLYMVCKVVEVDGEFIYTPLYSETFTSKQIEDFYNDELGRGMYER